MEAEVARLETKWLAQSQDETWLRDQQRVGLECGQSPYSEEQEASWRDLKIGAWFTTTPQPPQKPDDDWKIEADKISYYCDMTEAQELGKLV